MSARGWSGRPRQFISDLYEGDRLVAAGAAVELWTRNIDVWAGQIILTSPARVRAGQRCTLKTGASRRVITILDVSPVNRVWCLLFEQPAASCPLQLPVEPAARHSNGTRRLA